jgi:hypothetical protein
MATVHRHSGGVIRDGRAVSEGTACDAGANAVTSGARGWRTKASGVLLRDCEASLTFHSRVAALLLGGKTLQDRDQARKIVRLWKMMRDADRRRLQIILGRLITRYGNQGNL